MGFIGQAPCGNAVGRTWRALLRFFGFACIALAALGWVGLSLVGALSSPWMAQAWATLGAVSALLAIAREWRSAAVCAIALAALSLWVVPVLLPREEPAAARTLRIAYANVNAWNEPSDQALRWFASTDADAVALIECSPEWAEAIREVAGPGGRTWPHECARIDAESIAGVALFTRHPMRDAHAFIGPEGRFPMVDAVIESPAGPLRIMVAHPVPPVGFAAMQRRNAEIGWLAQRCADSTMPTAIVADFNDTEFGRALTDFRARSGMRSAASATGLVTTWPARVGGMPWPAPLRIAIDHCFVSREIGIASLSAGPAIGSDHLPLVIDISNGVAKPLSDGEPPPKGSTPGLPVAARRTSAPRSRRAVRWAEEQHPPEECPPGRREQLGHRAHGRLRKRPEREDGDRGEHGRGNRKLDCRTRPSGW